MFKNIIFLFICLLVLPSCNTTLPDEVAIAYQKLPEKLDFNKHVKPILSDKCFLCHGPDEAKRKAGLRLDLTESAIGKLPEHPDKQAIAPGRLNQSEVFHRILSNDPDVQMPTPDSHLFLTSYEKAVLIKWIEEGAEYQAHWAFVPPEKKDPPNIDDENWNESPIDQFIGQRLKQEDLPTTAEAPKELLLRRLSFDLTGLPPSAADRDAFMNDTSAAAYEKQVDRLLSSLHYGEKMAMDWMDLARYADTHGYQVDRYRDMSPWRDWVIESFNQNRPYDEFVIWQLAGDLLPQPTRAQILATGFNRLHPQNLEGGIVDEEFRVAYVSDRTDVLGQGLMGLTLACAKCHDHKFDPISQKNYYELYSFFNNINETGQISWEGATPVPGLLLPTKEQEAIIDFLEKDVQQKETQVAALRKHKTTDFEKWMDSRPYKASIKKPFPSGLVAHFDLETSALQNKVRPFQKAKMERKFSADEKPTIVKGHTGNGLLLDGDAWMDLGKIGIYKREQPFSIAVQVKIPKDLETGYIFHKGVGTRLHSFRGYHLYLKENKLELVLAHTWPDNAIVAHYLEDIPREEWIQLTFTYDGSSKAAGCKLYLNGSELTANVEIDNLYKDIIFHDMEDAIYEGKIEPGLQFGGRWRGKGIGGAIIDDILVYERMLTPLEVLGIAKKEEWQQVWTKEQASLTEKDLNHFYEYYLAAHSADYKKAIRELEQARQGLVDSLEVVQEVMVMKEMKTSRKAYILERGLYDSYGEEVFPNTPERILAMPSELPKNRLGLAKWLMNPNHPLTARVAVNRYWQVIFGRGLVKTTEDFGNQGELPSHPELLDWLAIQFIESGWDVKALIKMMVMSRAYRQDSNASDALRERDPDNSLLARGPSLRLTSEMIRDNALFASGLLNDKIGGESVRPYQPKGLWKFNNDIYVQDKGKKLYRRSMYTIWKRTVPHPTLATFDAPERSECTVRRQKTNTPLQALVLLNDPTYVEAAKVIGEQITRMQDIEAGIKAAFSQLTGRMPNSAELKILVNLQKKEWETFKTQSKKTRGWLQAGAYQVDANLDPTLLAANAVLASVIMNSDAVITKR